MTHLKLQVGDGDKSLELSQEEFAERYMRPAMAEWVRTHEGILFFGPIDLAEELRLIQ